MEEKNQNSLKLSVVDVEAKYKIDNTETISSGMVSWGPSNDIPKLYINCYEKSATLKATIDQSLNYVLGDGVEINPDAGMWQGEVNRRGETLEDIIAHAAQDYLITGNWCWEIIYNKIGVPVEIYSVDVTKCRLSEDKSKVYYSKKNWTRYQSKAEEFGRIGYAEYDPSKPAMMYFYNGTGVRTTYNKAPWSAAMDDVLCEIEGSRYSLNSVANGFACRYLLSLNGAQLTDSQKQIIEDGIREKFTGADATNFMIYYSESDETIDVKKLEANEDAENFQNIRNGARENVMVSLRMSPLLLGLGAAVGGTGFSTQEFSDSYKLYDRTVAEPIRRIIEKSLDKALGLKNLVRIIPFNIKFDNE